MSIEEAIIIQVKHDNRYYNNIDLKKEYTYYTSHGTPIFIKKFIKEAKIKQRKLKLEKICQKYS